MIMVGLLKFSQGGYECLWDVLSTKLAESPRSISRSFGSLQAFTSSRTFALMLLDLITDMPTRNA